MPTNLPITVAYGDGIGPEIMKAWLLLSDAYRSRFTASDGGATSKKTVALLGRVFEQGLEIVKTEALRNYNGVVGYTLSPGQ